MKSHVSREDGVVAVACTAATHVRSPAVTDLHLPAHCGTCGRASLTPARTTERVTCRKCGADAHIIPGEVYRAEDSPLFEQIDAVVYAADLSPMKTLSIVSSLSDVGERTHAASKLLALLVRPLPGLRFLELDHPHGYERVVRGLGMLLAIASARLQYRGHSAAPSAPPNLEQQEESSSADRRADTE